MTEITFRIRHIPTSKEYYVKQISITDSFEDVRKKFIEDIPEYLMSNEFILTHNYNRKSHKSDIPNFKL